MDLDLLLRSSALLFAALVVTRVLIRATAATRHLIWHIAVIAVLLAPLVIVIAPRFNVPAIAWMTAGGNLTETTIALASDESRPPAEDAIATIVQTGTWLVGAWFVLGWIVSAWEAARATRAPQPWVNDAHRLSARLGVRRLPSVRQVDRGSPQVAGLFRSVILIPSSALNWRTADREAALIHELSHIRRGDRRTQALAQLLCALYWFNPLAWVAAAALTRERERACDDEVLKAGVRPSDYASLLLDLARREHAFTAAAALGMARPSTIEGRLLDILATAPLEGHRSARRRRFTARRSTRWIVIAGGGIIATVILGAQQPSGSQPAATSSQEPESPSPMLMGLEERLDTAPITTAYTRALDDPDRQVREKAALGLALVPGAETVSPLLRALRDPDSQVREKAAVGLAFRRDVRVLDPLLRAMSDSDSHVREKVAIALGATGDRRALSALEQALDDPDAQVREKAAAGLILLGLRR